MHEMVLRDTLRIKHDDYLNGPVVHEALDDTIMRFSRPTDIPTVNGTVAGRDSATNGLFKGIHFLSSLF